MRISTRIPLIAGLPLLLVGALVLPGCNQDEGPGSVVVPFRLGPLGESCTDAEVVSVRVTVGDPEGMNFHVNDEICAAGEVRVDDIAPGTYPFLVEALDADGVTVLDNLGDSASERKVRVLGDGATKTVEEVVLTDSPAKLLVRWDFQFVDCATAGIDRFQIFALTQGGTSQLEEAEIDCDASPIDTSGYRLFEDPNRLVNGASIAEVAVIPKNAAGDTVGAPVEFAFTPPGRGRELKFTLTCDGGGCDGGPDPD